jgi:hypothetical protein
MIRSCFSVKYISLSSLGLSLVAGNNFVNLTGESNRRFDLVFLPVHNRNREKPTMKKRGCFTPSNTGRLHRQLPDIQTTGSFRLGIPIQFLTESEYPTSLFIYTEKAYIFHM